MQVFCRIDYHLATAGIATTAKSVAIYKDEKFSDHAPVTIEYDCHCDLTLRARRP